MDVDGKCDRHRTLYFQITNHRKWWNFQIVSTVQDYELTTLLIRLVSAVDNLVAASSDVDTLSISAGELILSTPCQLDSHLVGLFSVATFKQCLHNIMMMIEENLVISN